MATMNVVLNYLGIPIEKKYLDILLDGKDHSGDIEYSMIKHVLEFPPEHLSKDILERYVEISGKETYTAIFPHTDKLFERFLTPFKSAKRMYCLGEYLASIELSAHLGEMLALLVWQITPITFNKKPFEAVMEKAFLGSEFERMGQEKRINILKAMDTISQSDEQLFDHLRSTRRKYFHFWSTSTENIKDDALQCFLKAATLVKNILKIEYDKGAVKINPLLEAYLAKHKAVP